jgi:hypothetical protein
VKSNDGFGCRFKKEIMWRVGDRVDDCGRGDEGMFRSCFELEV